MKKLGVWLPSRPKLRKFSRDRPGIFLDEIASQILEALKQSYDIVEGLDFRKAVVRDGDVLINGFDCSGLDGYLWFSFLDKGSDNHDILALEQLGRHCKVINPAFGLKVGLDKFKTATFMKSIGVPYPEFAFLSIDDAERARGILREFGEVLVKPRFGGFGLGIFKTGDEQTLMDLIDYSGHTEFYLEKFYEHDFGRFCGVNVVGGRVLYGYGKEQSQIKGWKILDREEKGGKMVLRKPSEKQEGIALKIARETGLGFFGVDLIHTKDGEDLVVDLNTFPGIYPEMLEEAGENIGQRFLEMVSQTIGE